MPNDRSTAVAALSLREHAPPRAVASPVSPGSMGHGFDRNHTGPLSPSAAEAAQQQFPLNDIDYESNPAAVAQELSNLQALRRMSMDIGGASDPDLPSFNTFRPPEDEENEDPAELIWVPASLHPELAPQEFKTFVDTRIEQLKTGGVLPTGQLAGGGFSRFGSGGLSRKKSMLSKQFDNTGGRAASEYRDGADVLQRKRSQLRSQQPIELSDLESLDDPTALMRKLSIDSKRTSEDGERPVATAAPKGSLRRSTNTTYRRGSTRKEGRIGSSRGLRGDLVDSDDAASPVDDANSRDERQNFSRPGRATGRTRANGLEPTAHDATSPIVKTRSHEAVEEPVVPRIVETPPLDDYYDEEDHQPPPVAAIPKRGSSRESGSQPGPQPGPGYSQNERPAKQAQQAQRPVTDMNTIAKDRLAQSPTSQRTDSYTAIPVVQDDRRVDMKKKKEEPRKTSWMGKVFGGDEKDAGKKGKTTKGRNEKQHDSTRLDLLQTSIEGNGRPSQTYDREDARGKSGADKKEDKSGLFSFFGGGKKKTDRPTSSRGGKASSLRAPSPEPPGKILRPDVDYHYTRFPIIQERAIYRYAHLKLANPRRALLSQVLLSNFMYGYLAKVQQSHPQIQIAGAKRPGSTEAKAEAEKQKEQEKERERERQRLEQERQAQLEREREEERRREEQMEHEIRMQEEEERQRAQELDYYQSQNDMHGHVDGEDGYVYDPATNQYYRTDDQYYDHGYDQYGNEYHQDMQYQDPHNAPNVDLNLQNMDLGLDFTGHRQDPSRPAQSQSSSRPRSRKAQYDPDERHVNGSMAAPQSSGYMERERDRHQQYTQSQNGYYQQHHQNEGFSGGYHGGYAGYSSSDPRNPQQPQQQQQQQPQQQQQQQYESHGSSRSRTKDQYYQRSQPQPDRIASPPQQQVQQPPLPQQPSGRLHKSKKQQPQQQPASVYNRPERPW